MWRKCNGCECKSYKLNRQYEFDNIIRRISVKLVAIDLTTEREKIKYDKGKIEMKFQR